MVFLEVSGRSVVATVVVSRGWFMGSMRHFPGSAVAVIAGSAIAVMVVLAFAGCGRPSGVSFAPVTGRVVFNGQPLAAGSIHFFPDESKGNSGPMSTGVLQSDGSYALRGPGQNVGAMVGSHRVYLSMPPPELRPTPVLVDGKVVVQAPQRDAASGTAAKIPKKLLQAETSAWTATVSKGKTNVLDFEITK